MTNKKSKCTFCKVDIQENSTCKKCAAETMDILERLSPEERVLLHNRMQQILNQEKNK